MFHTNYLITPEECPKVYFPLYLETKISASEEHILSSFLASFQCFSLKLGGNIAQNHTKNGVSEVLLLASFESSDYFSEYNACFINSQSLTAL